MSSIVRPAIIINYAYILALIWFIDPLFYKPHHQEIIPFIDRTIPREISPDVQPFTVAFIGIILAVKKVNIQLAATGQTVSGAQREAI